jgi:hypothetical protein
MWGLGDNIYQRSLIKPLASQHDVYLETPWPELYDDTRIKFVKCERPLRTQLRNVRRQPDSRWSPLPRYAREIRIGYGSRELERGMSIVAAMERTSQLTADPFSFDLPAYEPPLSRSRPIAVVRPVTVRNEWFNEARNPLPRYIAEISRALMKTHNVVAVADVNGTDEWIDGALPPAHDVMIRGELNIVALLGLVANADVIVGGVGWIVPASVAFRRRAFIVLGGQGKHNAPDRLIDRRMDGSLIGFARPDNYCMCSNMRHKCNKTISNLMDQFAAFAKRTNLSVML